MRVIVAGLGIQGRKRQAIAGSDVVATVDPVVADADYKSVADVPVDLYDAALLCIPDGPKLELIDNLIRNGKHALVEKPLIAADAAEMSNSREGPGAGVACYTAYNHRFEPHFVRMKRLIESGELGQIYFCVCSTATAPLAMCAIPNGVTRAPGFCPISGHICSIRFCFLRRLRDGFYPISYNRFENRAFDRVVMASKGPPAIELEMTLLLWRNHFTCDVFAENGSAHISSLCKWGPSTFTQHTRTLPSGRPKEESVVLVEPDPIRSWNTRIS